MNYVANSRGFVLVGSMGMLLVAREFRLKVPRLGLKGNPRASVCGIDDLLANIFADLAGLYGNPRFANGSEHRAVGIESTRVNEESKDGDQGIDATDLEDILIGVGFDGGIDEGCGSDGQYDKDKEEEGGISGAVEDTEERNAKGKSRALDHRGQDMPEGRDKTMACSRDCYGSCMSIILLLIIISSRPDDVSPRCLAVEAEGLLAVGGRSRDGSVKIAMERALRNDQGRRDRVVESCRAAIRVSGQGGSQEG